MQSTLTPEVSIPLTLQADTAADLMTTNPVSLRADATVDEAITLLTDRGFTAAPVIDHAGRPIGVLSRTDVLIHDRECARYLTPASGGRAQMGRGEDSYLPDPARVRDLMTPVVFSVAPNAPAYQVIEHMLALKVHRLFVVDRSGALVGVISVLDVLRHLCP
jgi:CBS domain-containing protein